MVRRARIGPSGLSASDTRNHSRFADSPEHSAGIPPPSRGARLHWYSTVWHQAIASPCTSATRQQTMINGPSTRRASSTSPARSAVFGGRLRRRRRVVVRDRNRGTSTELWWMTQEAAQNSSRSRAGRASITPEILTRTLVRKLLTVASFSCRPSGVESARDPATRRWPIIGLHPPVQRSICLSIRCMEAARVP